MGSMFRWFSQRMEPLFSVGYTRISLDDDNDDDGVVLF